MKRTHTIRSLAFATLAMPLIAVAQVPDLVSAFDAGGATMGMGSAGTVIAGDTLSGYHNPAGLAYIKKSQITATLRNLPKTTSVARGNLVPSGSERISSKTNTGPTGLGHFGLAVPLGNGSRGTIGVAITQGGYVSDRRTAGAGLTEGGLPANGFTQYLENRTSFLTVSYGRSAWNDSLNWGVGLVYAVNSQRLQRSSPSGTTAFAEEATGLGAILGLQYNPTSNPNMSFGLSYRTPIKLDSGGGPLLFSEVPGRLSAGMAWRKDGFRNGRDSLVLAAQVDHFFEAGNGVYMGREAQSVFGVGAEYSFNSGSARIPLRFGYSFVPGAGRGFTNRDSFAFGLGYRPLNDRWGVDLSFGRPVDGGSDMSLSMTYKFGK